MALKSKLLKIGQFFKVVDSHDKNLSLTNLAVWVVIVKLATAKEAISPIDIGALIGTLLPYQAKKYINKMKDHNNNNNDQEIEKG